jgi:(p)ppGpp synthase/HD superfamily hydrolase
LLGLLFEQALVYATQVHALQLRKGTTVPYVSHLLSVTATVLEDGGDEDEAIAALLHDAAEDHGGRPRLEDIRRRFGDRVARIVEGCSQWDDDSDSGRELTWCERRARYVEHLRQAEPSVLRISVADKLHNARAILRDYERDREGLWQRFGAPRQDILWYYRALARTHLEINPSDLRHELDRVVRTLLEAVAAREGLPPDRCGTD